MNYKKIRTSTILMAIGYSFIIVSLFFNLNRIGINYASILIFFSVPGYLLLNIGIGLLIKQDNLFKASFIVFIFTNIIFLIFLSIGITTFYIKFSEEALNIINISFQIIQALLNALVAIASCLYSNGLKIAFTRINNKKMQTYSWVMAFSISKLIIVSAALPTIKITAISALAITILSIVIDFGIQISLLIYMIKCSHELTLHFKKYKE